MNPVDDAPQTDIGYPFPINELLILDQPTAAHASVVAEHVHPAELTYRCLGQ